MSLVIRLLDDDAAEPDPVFMIAGGPGQSALDSYGPVFTYSHYASVGSPDRAAA